MFSADTKSYDRIPNTEDMTSGKDDSDEPDMTALSVNSLSEKMEPLEPHTTDELAEKLDAERGIVRKLLDKLNRDGKVKKKKKTKSNPTIWVREPPVNRCSKCDRKFEIKYMHPVFSSAQFCPRCGNRL